MARKKQETLQPGYSLFDVLTDPGSQPSPIHSDVADTHVEELPGDVEPTPLFADAKPARRMVTAKNVSSEPLDVSALTQPGMFGEIEQVKIIKLEECFVVAKPTARKDDETGLKTWLCIFITPPDLWHGGDVLVHARTTNREIMKMAQETKLRPGDYVSVTGIVTSDEKEKPMSKGEMKKQVIYLNLTGLSKPFRSPQTKENILLPKRRRG